MTQAQYQAYLGRPLTSVEVTNLKLYDKLAMQTLETVLCIPLCNNEDPKLFTAREGYRTVFCGIFTDITEVKIDDVVTTAFLKAQSGKWQGDWYNSLIFDNKFTKPESIVSVSASWGFQNMPADLQAMQAAAFDLITKKNAFDGTVSSKKVEDFTISFNADADLDTEFYDKFKNVIAKYGQCDIVNVQSGSVCY